MLVTVPNLYGAAAVVANEPGTPSPVTDVPMEGYLGIGIMSTPYYVGSGRNHFWLAPLANFDYDDLFYVHLDRAGVRLWSNRDKSMALGMAAELQFGFHARDGALLTGMKTRYESVESGPTFEWELPQISMSVAYLSDFSDTSDGRVLHVSFFHQLIDRKPWDLGVYADVEYDGAKTARYFFGVRPDEATSMRPAYRPDEAIKSSLGLTGAYRFDRNFALLFGAEATALGGAAADSPIVRSTVGYTTYIGLGLAF